MNQTVFKLSVKLTSEHTDPLTGEPELILLGFHDSETCSEHLSRYVFAKQKCSGLVLDIASGTCYGSSIINRANSVKGVISVDINKNALLYGEKIYDCEQLIQADVQHLPFRNEVFDTMVSFEILEHIMNQRHFLKEIQRCLIKGGRLIMSTPNKLYYSPLLPNSLNPFHSRELYLSDVLPLVERYLNVEGIYGQRRFSTRTLIRRILGFIVKFLLSRFKLSPHFMDRLYNSIFKKEKVVKKNLDPDPKTCPVRNWEPQRSRFPYSVIIIEATKRRR